jgi:uncharacterized membrane protein
VISLIPNAKVLWPKLWSVRLAALAAVLSGMEVGLPFLMPDAPSRLFSALAMLIAVAAAGARVVAQTTLPKDAEADK